MGPKKFGVEIEKFCSFKIIAHRFLIKTNVGKILGAERFGPKQFGSRKKLSPKKCWSKKVWIQNNYGSTNFWVHIKILGRIFFKFCVQKNLLVQKSLGQTKFVPKELV